MAPADVAARAGAAGVSWAGGAELCQLWVEADRCGAGRGRLLVEAFEEAARAHAARNVFVSTHTFQAPSFYQRLGDVVTRRWEEWPAGHAEVHLVKAL